ncbi:MAG: PD-(D/E)XK nuclease family protein [Bacteroidetes bacterium]|nr:MAG: PD-(D/E)XK nuclease family protein [Bacteroidota bacterium]
MTRFLEKTADYLYETYGDKISDLCIVVPNRRAGLFLQKYLGNSIGKTFWSPAIFSIEDFLINISGLRICDPTQVLFELYEIHKLLEGKNAQPFDEFTSWAQQLLGDFNEIDSYLVDAKDLFSFLNEAKALSVWNLDNKPLTDFEKQYLRFFNSLYTYHEQLSVRLISSSLAYPGLLFRKTAEQIGTIGEKIPWGKIIFAGFNALTKAEEVIIDSLVSIGKTEMLWDADAYYMEDEKQEAGFFLRMWKRKWKNQPFNWIGKDFAESSAKIRVIGVPYHVGQAKLCGELLSQELLKDHRAEDTAVVMMDEQVLLPVLNSLPPVVKELNITMGLPLRQTPVYDLFDTIFRMHENTSRFERSGTPGKEKFYYRDILRVLQHPYAARMAGTLLKGNAFILEDLVAEIRSGSRVFLGKEELTQSGKGIFSGTLGFLEPVFDSWQDPLKTIDCLRRTIAHLRDGFLSWEEEKESRSAQIEVEFLYAFSRIIYRLSTLIEKYNAIKNLKVFHSLFNQLAGFTSLPFYGEPLRGLQMMGMLETRTLDFDNLILLSVNEDLIPRGKTTQSFIPFDIRRHFHLPTYQHKNSIYAYHFYRLIQRAKQVYLLYNTESDELGGGEKSRFVKQILHELRTYNPNISIEEEILVTSPLKTESFPAIQVPKTGDVAEKLMKKAETGFSPSSLNNYIQCPLKFYLQDLLGLREDKEVEETIDSQVLGLAIHETLEKLYQPYKEVILTEEAIDQMLPLYQAALDNAFRKKFKGSDVAYGKNLLLVRVASILVKKFLEKEKELVGFLRKEGSAPIVSYLEKPLAGRIEIGFGDKILDVKLKGFVDRIDKIGEEWRIIDYKSGSVSPAALKFEDWNELKEDSDLAKIIQLYTYAYLFRHGRSEKVINIRAGIISLRKLNEGFMQVPSLSSPVKNDSLIGEKDLVAFEKILKEILEKVYDFSIQFMQTEDVKRCENCDFVNLCDR